MCGIAGFASSRPWGRERQAVKEMLPYLARRGPNAEGIEAWPGVAFGHRRLAVLDLSELGNQPMVSDDGNVGLVFNGCIYNFLELRQELKQCGISFRSECDTEVLLRGYQEWGIDKLVAQCRVLFAFAIWDQPRRTLYLVRDRLGVKPLVYAEKDNEIAFASTISALRRGETCGPVDPDAVLEFLEFGYITDDFSIYRGVKKLPAATILEWKDGHASQRRYWSPPAIDESSKITFEEAVEETERLIVESVRLRLCSDVPIGVLLSGGIDSTLVCWAMKRLNADVKAFTVGTPGDPSDESAHAADIAKTLGIGHEVVTLGAVGEPALTQLADAFSEPFACQSALGLMRVSAAIKPHATVLLTGDGGDDVYLGYPHFYNAWRAQRLARRLPNVTPRLWEHMRPLFAGSARTRRAKNFIDYTVGGLGAYTRVRDGLPYYDHQLLLGEELRDRHLAQRQMQPSFASARNLLADVFAYHYKTEFRGEFMPKVDGSTMYYSLEARAPLLDHKLWEFAAALPAEIRFHGGQLKAVLREIVRRRVGPDVADRRKQGFTIPAEKWIATHWRNMLELLRSGTRLESDGWIRRGAMTPVIDQALQRGSAPKQLWYLLILENWFQQQQQTAESEVVLDASSR